MQKLQKKLTSCSFWAQANRKGFCVRCFEAGWPAVLDQIDAQTKPSASAFLLNNKTTSPEDACTEVLNQGVTTSPAAGLLALQNHDPPPSETDFNEGTMINSINVTSQETDDCIKNIEQQVTQNNEIIETLKNELIIMERKLATLQQDMNFSVLFNMDNSDISDIDDNINTATNNYEENKDGMCEINYNDDIELHNNNFHGTGVCIASSCKADPSHNVSV